MSLRRASPHLLSRFGFVYSGESFFKFCAMNIRITRPLVFFDLETTGLSTAKDRICQLSFTKFYPNKDADTKTRIINPTIPIPEEASKVHGIYDKHVKDEPKFEEVARSLSQQLEGCDVAGYNIMSYDVPLLREEFLRCKIDWPKTDVRFVDVYKLVALAMPRKLEKLFPLLLNQESSEAHDAEFDNMMTIEVISRLIDSNSITIPNDILNGVDTVEELWELCKPKEGRVDFSNKIVIDRAGDYVFNFGDKIGRKITDYKAYCQWMLSADFTEDTKNCIMTIFRNSKILL